ncbi:MAG: efflux RND transporter permease subunit, partial [Clostridia bacterium]|nr:efflux RND transporter permease subunit [Clostridia bacterium]
QPEPEPQPEPAPPAEAAPAEAPAEAARLPFARALAEGEDVPALKARLSEVRAQLSETERAITAGEGEIAEQSRGIAALERERDVKQRALDTLTDNNEDIEARVDEAETRIASLEERIAALDRQIAAMDSALATGQGDAGALAGQLAVIGEQIHALEDAGVEQAAALVGDPKRLKAQYNEARSGLSELDKGIAALDANIDKLKQGIIPGGYIDGIDKDTKLSDAEDKLKKARAKLESAFSKAESALAKASKQLAKARKEFNEKREDAFKEAGLDGVITVQMVAQIIGAQNFSMPAGYVRDLEDDRVLVRVGDKFGAIEELKRMKLFNLDMDTIDEVRLLDVASVKLTDNRADVFAKQDGRDGILLSLEKQSTYSTADVADTVMKKVKELQAADPNLHIMDLMNQGEYIDLVVSSVLDNLLIGGGLAILILLLFLLDWRPTLTVAFSIPISVVVAFVAMYFSGITLNVLSLSGLALGIGMLVDNSIVSIENIYRLHDEERLPLLRSCVEGVKSVSGALFASTLTTICVFLPIVFVQGMARDLFEDMGLTIAYSLLASLLVAMTVVPMMCSFLMRRSKPKKHRVFKRLQAAYGAVLRGALRVKPLVLLMALALLVFSGMQVTGMGISFMPEVNSRQMSATLTPDKDMSDAAQKAQATQIMTDIMALKGIESIGLMDGSGSILNSGGGFSYYITVDQTAGVKNVELARQIDAIGDKYNADLVAQSTTMDISMMTGSGITVEITGDDIEELQRIAKDVADLARNTEGVIDVNDGLEDAVPELRIVVEKEKAIDKSLTTAQVYQFIAQKLLEKTEVGKVTLSGKEMKIQLIEGRNRGIKPGDIEDLEIEVEKEEEDELVRISDISDIRDALSLSTINRADQRRMVSVSFDTAEGYSANLVSDAFEAKLRAYKLPDGYKAVLSGENETVMGIMEDLVWMILVAVLLIFLIMVAQYQSFKSPIIVMFTIPLAFTGGLLALIITGMDLSIVAMIGFLVLSGVVVNNGIVFIDCVNQLRIAGWEKRDALVEAGRQRLRPILMTALTTILGMSTMALGKGTGAEMMQPMAVVSIGGLTYATLMTLFVVPVLYDLLNGKKMKAREIQMIREAAGMNDGSFPEEPALAAPTPPVAPVEKAPAEEPALTAPAAPVAPTPPVAPVTPVEPDAS